MLRHPKPEQTPISKQQAKGREVPLPGQGMVQPTRRAHLGTGLRAVRETEPDTAVQEHLRVTNKLKHLEAELGRSALSDGIQVCHCLIMGTPGTQQLSQQVANKGEHPSLGHQSTQGLGAAPKFC